MIPTLGLSGTQQPIPIEKLSDVLRFLVELPRAKEYRSGACVGFDALAGQEMLQLYPPPMAEHVVYVPGPRSKVDWWFNKYPRDVRVEFMPANSTYKDRNIEIADVQLLAAVPLYRESHPLSTRSGTWQTIRLARAAGVPVALHILNDD